MSITGTAEANFHWSDELFLEVSVRYITTCENYTPSVPLANRYVQRICYLSRYMLMRRLARPVYIPFQSHCRERPLTGCFCRWCNEDQAGYGLHLSKEEALKFPQKTDNILKVSASFVLLTSLAKFVWKLSSSATA